MSFANNNFDRVDERKQRESVELLASCVVDLDMLVDILTTITRDFNSSKL